MIRHCPVSLIATGLRGVWGRTDMQALKKGSIWMILDGAETLLKFLHLGKQIVEPDMFSVYH